MRIDWIRMAGLAVAISMALILWTLVTANEFPVLEYAESDKLVGLVPKNATAIGQEVGRFLWNYRVFDLIAQAFVLFAAAACCLALLRVEEREI